jgi:hypothetical protein
VTALMLIGVVWMVVERFSAVTTTSSIVLLSAGCGAPARGRVGAKEVSAVAPRARAFRPRNCCLMLSPRFSDRR